MHQTLKSRGMYPLYRPGLYVHDFTRPVNLRFSIPGDSALFLCKSREIWSKTRRSQKFAERTHVSDKMLCSQGVCDRNNNEESLQNNFYQFLLLGKH